LAGDSWFFAAQRAHTLWLTMLVMFVIALVHCRYDTLLNTLTGIFLTLTLVPLLAAIAVEQASACRGRKH